MHTTLWELHTTKEIADKRQRQRKWRTANVIIVVYMKIKKGTKKHNTSIVRVTNTNKFILSFKNKHFKRQ